MINSPKVSVIVPVFNAGEGFRHSIESLLNQTLQNLEVIVVNDASTDCSATIINELASENSRIVAIHFDENKGVHEARLAGLKVASGSWIGFLDADDFARPKMYQTMLNYALQQDVDIVICGSSRVTKERNVISPKLVFKHAEKVDSQVFEKFCQFKFGTGMLWNKLYAREIILPYADMHFPWRQNINEDLLLNIGCFHDASAIYLCSETLHEYVYNEMSVTSTVDNAKAYVSTFRAFALAVNFYSNLGAESSEKIVDMYRTQFLWGDYSIDELKEISVYRSELEEAIELIYSTSPIALSLLAARRRSAKTGVKHALRILVDSTLSFFGVKIKRIRK